VVTLETIFLKHAVFPKCCTGFTVNIYFRLISQQVIQPALENAWKDALVG